MRLCLPLQNRVRRRRQWLVAVCGKSDKFAAMGDLLMFPEIEACLSSRPVCVSTAVHSEEFKCGCVFWKDVNGVSVALGFFSGSE